MIDHILQHGRMLPGYALLLVVLLASGTAASYSEGESVKLPASRPAASSAAKRAATGHSVARLWNEELLAAIRADTPRPTVHARNLFHVSAAMYDAWAAYDPASGAVFLREMAEAEDSIEKDRIEAISFAAYRVLTHRFAASPGQPQIQTALDSRLSNLGFDIDNESVIGSSPAAIGNRIGAAVIRAGLEDGANEAGDYVDNTGHVSSAPILIVEQPGTNGHSDLNAWQPLQVSGHIEPQEFLTPHWFNVATFALSRPLPGEPYADPGMPPLLGDTGDADLKQQVLELIRQSARLDPGDGEWLNVSPAVVGNNSLGKMDGRGHAVNPATGLPYPDNWVRRGDWGRVLAEFWADGPDSSTPPGHWNGIANAISDHPAQTFRLGGSGPALERLEWDIKLYLALNGALHDSVVATWEVKRMYESSRPITLIRGMGELGQSTSADLPSFHPLGLPLEPGLVEIITADSILPAQRHEHLAAHVGEIAVLSWMGHPADPETQIGGVGWIRAVEWLPYQQRDFVTPAFPGYVSGHSGFSRAGATVLARFTGDPYFPGGLGEFVSSMDAGGFKLAFESGPSEPTVLQWATYYDAADEAGISRIPGGIHPLFDDLPGRLIGHRAGNAAFNRSLSLFASSAQAVPVPLAWSTGWILLALSMMLAGILTPKMKKTKP